uniref:Phospholipid/glycerol acyltransferase domain-containing protein n=1 Tax=Chromera velia CCMP2878 TaxID=1169474 RepID=A0A0G4G8W7_9ALVE|mmetsp:Transcript_54063/g.105775  ORF Transcript_54063/g.105775 Transcript_54063/m.105775 type:complete len:478 (+) Transcript_54063:168-1601(+)|eukprot:Cvel_592.t1-p1 / transcript=Cvel_592.t1 / gene=Cvel_592 / organism=Chromera_velia_CCMP2878 / gene_product=1-acyl-sn-glycerol-3-phosphate acyltransferase 1,, putative / transcript_product=1-acyl-sn-glycerol-3-phosphate acyltransferase 1,, putative / location=Cvel_scaffold18:111622-114534(+) / protein_length=477 / sequence_SO=supercontig / SO=protein_coding / is_pseudo=false
MRSLRDAILRLLVLAHLTGLLLHRGVLCARGEGARFHTLFLGSIKQSPSFPSGRPAEGRRSPVFLSTSAVPGVTTTAGYGVDVGASGAAPVPPPAPVLAAISVFTPFVLLRDFFKPYVEEVASWTGWPVLGQRLRELTRVSLGAYYPKKLLLAQGIVAAYLFVWTRLVSPSPKMIYSEKSRAMVMDPGRHWKVKGKLLNGLGLVWMSLVFLWAAFWYPLLICAFLVSEGVNDKKRSLVDMVVAVWSRFCLWNATLNPKVEGLENLPKDKSEPLLIVANHSSFLDIPVLSAFLPIRFKYISKVEVLSIPLLGWAMQMARHVAIHRGDRRSSLKTFRETVNLLKEGASVCAFAEETRSRDGRVRKFKPGTLKMAEKAGVRVLPVSLCGLHSSFPPDALLPVAVPRDARLVIHPPIETRGRSVDDVVNEAWEAVVEGLPEAQKPKQQTVADDLSDGRKASELAGKPSDTPSEKKDAVAVP